MLPIVVFVSIGFGIYSYIQKNNKAVKEPAQTQEKNQSKQKEQNSKKIENAVAAETADWKSADFYFSSSDDYLFNIRYPSDLEKLGRGGDKKILEKNATTIFFKNNDPEKKPILSIHLIQNNNVESIVDYFLKQKPYKTAAIQATEIGNYQAKLIHLDYNDVLAFVPLLDWTIVFRAPTSDWKTFENILKEANFTTEELQLRSAEQYKSQNNIRNILAQKADFDGDKIYETVLSYVSDDEYFDGNHRTNGHLKVIDSSGKIIKEDSVGYYDDERPNIKFNIIQVVDLGYDGKQELIVQKMNQSTPYNEIRYYVFGFFEGEYTDYPISKGYLHPEKYFDCKINKDGLINADDYRFLGIEMISNTIQERYSISSDCKNSGDDRIYQHYKEGVFYPEVINNKPVADNYYVKNGFIWGHGKKLINEKLDDLIEHNGEGVLDYTIQFDTDRFTEIYLTDGRGCGGCVWFLPAYLRIDKNDDSVKILKFDEDAELPNIHPENVLISPDKTKMAFTPFGQTEENRGELWIYDFKTRKSQLLKTFKRAEASVFNVMGIDDKLSIFSIEWQIDSKHIIVKPYLED